MVAKTPTKERRALMALNSNQVRETLKKVDKCMARLQELQYTVTGGSKVISGVSLSPRSTKGYFRTSLRCKQETIRMKGSPAKKSPIGKFQGSSNGDWRQTSLNAMLLGETVVEILQASQFAKDLVSTAKSLSKTELNTNPRTPIPFNKNRETISQLQTPLRLRRTREKQNLKTKIRETVSRTRIQFKSISPNQNKPSVLVSANRVSPKNRPWSKKTVLFPNPSFESSSPVKGTGTNQRFYKTRSPIIPKTTKMVRTPHKFVIKSPPKCLGAQLKYQKAIPVQKVEQVRGVKPVPVVKARRCSFSPVKMVSRLVSPLKGRISPRKSIGGMISGLKQRPGFGSNSNLRTGRKI